MGNRQAYAVALLALSAPVLAFQPVPAEKIVTPVRPLKQVLESLSLSGDVLRAASGLSEVKLLVLEATPSRDDLLRRLAELLGSEWRHNGAGERVLCRKEALEKWNRDWGTSRRRAVTEARRYQAAAVRRLQQQAFAALDKPLQVDESGQPVRPQGVNSIALTRLTKSLDARQFEALVECISQSSPVRSGGEWKPRPWALTLPYKQLSQAQQGYVRDWLSEESARPEEIGELPNSTLLLGTINGEAGVSAALYLPGINRYRISSAANGAMVDLAVERELQSHLYQLMAARGTPPGALLGASLTREGKVEPAVALADPTLVDRKLSGLPANGMAVEFLPALARAVDLTLVADYHTRSARLPLPPNPTFRAVLDAAAEKFQLVFRQDGRFLLARNRFWPDRDVEETPFPHPERWLATKKQGEGLELNEMKIMGGLTEAQLDGLNAYRDPIPRFYQEVDSVRRHRWLWLLVRSLSPEMLREARGADDLGLRRLSLNQRNLIGRSIPVPRDWTRLHLYLPAEVSRPGQTQFVRIAAPGSDAQVFLMAWQIPVPDQVPPN